MNNQCSPPLRIQQIWQDMPITAWHIKQSYAIQSSLLICPAHVARRPSCCSMKFTCVMCQCKSLSLCKGPGKQSATEPLTVAARVQIQLCCKSSPSKSAKKYYRKRQHQIFPCNHTFLSTFISCIIFPFLTLSLFLSLSVQLLYCFYHRLFPWQPSAHFFPPWHKLRLLEDSIIWRDGGVGITQQEGVSHQSSSVPFLHLPSPALLHYLFLHVYSLSPSVCLPSPSLFYPIFSQGWTCAMALLSPPCHQARPI